MPPIDRKYAKQNLKRAIGHCDDIIGYLQSTGIAFLNKGQEVEATDGEFPESYLQIMDQIAACEDGQNMVKQILIALEASF